MAQKSWIMPTFLGLVLFFLCLWLTELPSSKHFLQLDPFWVSLAIIGQGGFATAMPYRWQLMSKGAGIVIPYGPAFCVTAYASLAAAVIPQSVADLAGRGPWEARYTGCGLLNATNVILCDRLLDVFVIGLLLFPALIFARNPVNMDMCVLAAMMLLIFGMIFLLLAREKFFLLFELMFRWARWCFEKTPFLKGKFNWHVSPVTLDFYALIQVWMLSVFKFFVIAFTTYAYFKAMRLDVSPVMVFFALPLTQFVFIFSFTPGGIGVFELGWVGILGLHGLSAQDISLFIVSQRLCFTAGVAAWAAIAWLCHKFSPQWFE